MDLPDACLIHWLQPKRSEVPERLAYEIPSRETWYFVFLIWLSIENDG